LFFSGTALVTFASEEAAEKGLKLSGVFFLCLFFCCLSLCRTALITFASEEAAEKGLKLGGLLHVSPS